MKPMTEQAAEAAIRVACRELHLPTIAAEGPRIADDATRERLTHRGFLAEVLAAEVDERAARRKARRLLEAHFPRLKRLEDFDTTVAPGVPPATVAALQAGAFIDAGAPVVLLGDSGTGKSHLLIGMGVAACEAGRRVRYLTTAALVNELVEAAGERVLSRTVARYGRYDLVCLDELGYLHLDARGAELLFQVLTEREEKASVAAASNAPFSEWGQTFTDPRLAAAIVDRLTFNALIIQTGSQSYRLRATRSAKKDAMYRDPLSSGARWCVSFKREREEVPMRIVGGLDVHRSQITFDWVDTDTGQGHRGQLAPATREHLRGWLEQFTGSPAAFALEGCTGWRYVVEELQQAGIAAHLAEPADTSAARGPKRHAKTDKQDARHLRELLARGTLPESWIPPAQVLEVRTRVRLYKALLDEHTAWLQRVHATLFHHGVPAERNLLAAQRRARLEAGGGLSPAARELVTVALRMLDQLDSELDRLRGELTWFAGRQPGCRALDELYGIGPVTAVAIWAELGDPQRFSSSRHAVRHTGLDVTVYSSNGKRTPGRLARQGPPVLRWALFEAAKCAARVSSPDHAYYLQVKDRLGGNRATLAVARKLVRRCYHTLRALGDQAFAPARPAGDRALGAVA